MNPYHSLLSQFGAPLMLEIALAHARHAQDKVASLPLIRPNLIQSDLIQSNPIQPNPTQSNALHSKLIQSTQIQSNLI